MHITVEIEGTVWQLRTAAATLRTYCDRGPISDREAVEKMADAIEAKVEAALDA